MRHLFADSGLVPGLGVDESRSVESITQLISNDLGFLVPLLRKFPKCYWIWNYRLWLLEQASSLLPADTSLQFWLRELSLVGKMLTLDSRNFLGWGYRRTVVAALESSSRKPTKEPPQGMAEQEFQYTTRMIEANLSNFSAWHSRSKLIPRLLNEQEADATTRQEFLDSGTLPATVAPFMLSQV
jgi:geranylgeranyl transferase type-2 subunit alpha